MPFTTVSGARLYWKLEGREDAPALVLLNSIGSDMDLWDGALPFLRPHFRLLRIDTRGHGASEATAGDYTLDLLAADVVAIMDAAGLFSATVAGVSLGGMMAMQMALSYPERVKGLALICTSATMDRQAWANRIETIRQRGMLAIADMAMGRFLSPEFSAAHPDIAATLRTGLVTMRVEGYAGCGAAIRDMSLLQHLPHIRQPTLVVTGLHDTSTPLQGHGDVLVNGIPGARLVQLPAAHLAPVDAPQALATAIEQAFSPDFSAAVPQEC